AVGRQRDERALADRVPGAEARQRIGDRALGGGLHPRIESGADDQVAVGGAGEIADLVGDPIGEIARARPRLGERRRSGALLSGVMNRTLASCCVIVLPHCTRWPARRSATAARTRPTGSMQKWL